MRFPSSLSLSFVVSAGLLVALAALVGCGSSGNGSGPGDASTEDATSSSSSGGDSGGGGAGDASDAALFDAAPVCPGKGVACETCCDNAYPAGAKKFDQITLTCACVPGYCGALDGGADASDDAGVPDAGSVDAGSLDASAADGSADTGAPDAAVFGVGACTATCGGTAAPDPTCNTCIRDTLGSQTSPGPCGVDILANCVTDPDCHPYFQCVTQCE